MSQIYQTPPGLKASGCQEIKHISTSTKIESIECVSLPRTYQLKRYQASVHFILVTKRSRQDPFSCQKSPNLQRRHSEPLLDRGRWTAHPLPHTTHHNHNHNHTPYTIHHIPLAHPTPHHTTPHNSLSELTISDFQVRTADSLRESPIKQQIPAKGIYSTWKRKLWKNEDWKYSENGATPTTP